MDITNLESKLKQKEIYLDKLNAEQYATAGQVVLLREMIDEIKNPKKKESPKDGKSNS